MDAKQVFKHRLIISGLILVAWFSLAIAGAFALALTLILIGALIGTFVRVRSERAPKNIRWFIVITAGALVSYLVGSFVAAAGNSAAESSGEQVSLLVVITSFLLLLTSLFFTARLGIEGYLSWVARGSKK
jgi:sulfite exporter TauE/SafE